VEGKLERGKEGVRHACSKVTPDVRRRMAEKIGPTKKFTENDGCGDMAFMEIRDSPDIDEQAQGKI
jgi:hypothetical protein